MLPLSLHSLSPSPARPGLIHPARVWGLSALARKTSVQFLLCNANLPRSTQSTFASYPFRRVKPSVSPRFSSPRPTENQSQVSHEKQATEPLPTSPFHASPFFSDAHHPHSPQTDGDSFSELVQKSLQNMCFAESSISSALARHESTGFRAFDLPPPQAVTAVSSAHHDDRSLPVRAASTVASPKPVEFDQHPLHLGALLPSTSRHAVVPSCLDPLTFKVKPKLDPSQFLRPTETKQSHVRVPSSPELPTRIAQLRDPEHMHTPLPLTKFKDLKDPNKTPLVLLCCGCFSPITLLHLRIFEQARDFFATTTEYTPAHSCEYEVVGGVVSPVHDLYNKEDLSAARHRVNMCRLATRDSDWIEVSTWEAEKEEWSRIHESLGFTHEYLNRHLASKYGKQVAVKLLCGGDLLQFITENQKYWLPIDLTAIFGQYGMVCVERKGWDSHGLINNQDESNFLYNYRHNIHLVPQPVDNTVSSTAVRGLLKGGQSIKYLVPPSVEEYIRVHKLFRNKNDVVDFDVHYCDD